MMVRDGPDCNLIQNKYLKTLPKAQRTRVLSSAYQNNLIGHITGSYTNFDLKNLAELQHQNLDQTFCDMSEQKLSFITKHQLLNL